MHNGPFPTLKQSGTDPQLHHLKTMVNTRGSVTHQTLWVESDIAYSSTNLPTPLPKGKVAELRAVRQDRGL